MRLVDFNTAKALQELGYDGEYYYRYCKGKLERSYGRRLDTYLKAPRLDDVAYWMRDKHGIYIATIMDTYNSDVYFFSEIKHRPNKVTFRDITKLYDDYDDALEAAVKKAIEIIKTKDK